MKPVSSILSDDTFHLVRDKFSQQPGKEVNDFQGPRQDMTNFDDLKSELLKLLEELSEINSGNKENFCQFGQTCIF